MPTAAVQDIIIHSDRQRKEFDPDAMQELALTIADKGLMHAIVVRETIEGLVLVAGERRLRAIQDMWMLGSPLRYNNEVIEEGRIPYVTLGDLTALEAEEAELEENLRRKDLTWQEQAAATSKLHRIRTEQARAEGRIHTVADTALESRGRSDGSYQQSVRQDVILAKHLGNPAIAKAKSAFEAFKILKKAETAQSFIKQAAETGKTFSASSHEIIHADCLEYLAASPSNVFDVILTDPPYGMNADQFSDGGAGRLNGNEHHYDDSLESWTKLMEAWCPLSYRVAKPQAHAYVFCDIDNFPKLKELMKGAGWYVFRTPFICVKPNSGRVPLPEEGPRRQYETLLYAIKGHKHTTAIYPDVLSSTADSGFNHGAQKPVALYSDLLRRSVRPGDTVLDCFAGTGTIFPAAHEHQCKAVGVERSAEYYAMGLQRLRDLSRPKEDGAALGAELMSMMRGR